MVLIASLFLLKLAIPVMKIGPKEEGRHVVQDSVERIVS